ncbi:hypothetical protein ANTPLA_LOCUS3650 [Anthophora plagiata]
MNIPWSWSKSVCKVRPVTMHQPTSARVNTTLINAASARTFPCKPAAWTYGIVNGRNSDDCPTNEPGNEAEAATMKMAHSFSGSRLGN